MVFFAEPFAWPFVTAFPFVLAEVSFSRAWKVRAIVRTLDTRRTVDRS